MSEAAQKVVMVSGANRGIGRAIVEELAGSRWRVSMGCRRPGEVSSWLPPGAKAFRFEAHDPASEEAWVAATKAHFGRIDAIVHCAGIMIPTPVLEATDEDFDAIFNVNVKSPMRLSRLAWPHLLASGDGRIVTIASLSSKRVKADRSGLYSMSKFAVLALAHALRRAGHAHAIRSTAICPGLVRSDMSAGLSDVAPEKMTQPGDVARIVRTVLELPATASVAEIPVNWTMEDSF